MKAADEDTILTIAAHLPSEAAEAVLDIAVGVKPKPAVRLPAGADPFAHPDAQRRFRSMGNHDQLAAALDFPWEKWTVFLHPDQRALVERDYAGPARVAAQPEPAKPSSRFIAPFTSPATIAPPVFCSLRFRKR